MIKMARRAQQSSKKLLQTPNRGIRANTYVLRDSTRKEQRREIVSLRLI